MNTQTWTTKDYFDPWPGWYAGLAKRQVVNSEQNSKFDQSMRKDSASFRNAQELGRLGVPAVTAPDGSIDWQATQDTARKVEQGKEMASRLGRLHGMIGGPSSWDSEEEYQLSTTPEYKTGYAEGEATREQLRIREEAQRNLELMKIQERAKASNVETIDIEGKKYIRGGPNGRLVEVKNVEDFSKGAPVVGPDGKPIEGLYNVNGRVFNVKPDPFASIINGVGQPSAGDVQNSSGTKVIKYDKTGKPIK